jgi:coenzyme PQQ synthesis protein D (PqqD)
VSGDEGADAMIVSLEGRAFATSRVLYKDLGDEAILLDLETETYFGLNAAGTRLWSLLTTAPTIRDAFESMLEEYDVSPAELERDMTALIEELVGRGLLRTGHA